MLVSVSTAEFIYGIDKLESSPGRQQGSVVCIGAFDGVHLGHQAILAEAVARARSLSVLATALILEPLPREYFHPDSAPPRLLPLRRPSSMGRPARSCSR